MKRLLCMALVLCMALGCAVCEGAEASAFTIVPEVVRPGRVERVSFTAAAEGAATVTLKTSEGILLYVLRQDLAVAQGQNNLSWNGCYASGLPVTPGEYLLCVEMNGQSVETTLTVGEPSPQIKQAYCDGTTLIVDASERGTLLVQVYSGGEYRTLFEGEIDAGLAAFDVFGTLPTGAHTLSLRLTANGFSGSPLTASITVGERKIFRVSASAAVTEAPTTVPVPTIAPLVTAPPVVTQAPVVTQTQPPEDEPDEEPADEPEDEPADEPADEPTDEPADEPTAETGMDDEELWAKLTGEVTVVLGDGLVPVMDHASGATIGGVAGGSQCVTVLSQSGGWAEISFFNADATYDLLDIKMTGYVQQSQLQTLTPRDDFGLVLDKETQTLTVYQKGEALGAMSVSSGLVTSETVSGQFLVTERTGDIEQGGRTLGKALKLYGDVYISELPSTETSGEKTYVGETQLGKKSTGGGVYVPHEKNADGLSMQLLWNKIKKNASVLVLDDDDISQKPDPNASLVLYYNPDGGENYHIDADCSGVRKRYRPLKGSFLYPELNDPAYVKLTPCKSCKPPERPESAE